MSTQVMHARLSLGNNGTACCKPPQNNTGRKVLLPFKVYLSLAFVSSKGPIYLPDLPILKK